MTLLLASSGKFITDGDLSFLSKPINQMKMAYITTASKGTKDTSYIQRHKKRMLELGYNFTEIDLDGKTEIDLRQALADKEIVCVDGGNTFYLLKAIRDSGFEKIIRDLIERGVVYIGVSAGAYVACPTIEMATWKRQDKYDRYNVTDFTGLNLVPFLVTAHYAPEYAELIREKIHQSNYEVKILTDEQAILVRDRDVKLIGGGREVKL